MIKKINKAIILEYINMAFATIFIFLPIYFCIIHYAENNEDFRAHIRFAQDLLTNSTNVPKSVIAHAAWQWLVISIKIISNQSWKSSALVVTIGSVVLTSFVLFWILRKYLNPFLACTLSIGIQIITPIFFIYPENHFFWAMMNGYIGPNVYHNPTILLLKPFAIIQFYYSINALIGVKTHWKGYIIPAICSIVAVYSKPSLAICFLPIIVLLSFIRIIRKLPIDWKGLLFAIIIPTTAILVWQFAITFGQNSDSGIIFAPFVVMKHYSSDLLIKLFLSILFPIIVTIAYLKTSLKDIRIQLGWLVFGVGLICSYLFSETGVRMFAGNFVWSGEITLFILFIGCILFLIEKRTEPINVLSKWLIYTSALLHVGCGIFYYFYMFFSYNIKYF